MSDSRVHRRLTQSDAKQSALKRQIQGGFRIEEIPAEIVPEMRQATDAICDF
jgi:hypothetical protein